MAKARKIGGRIGATVTIEEYENSTSRLHDYGLTPATWRRGAKFIRLFGGDQALELMNQRAELAMMRGDMKACVRWRNLMAAVHAIESAVPLSSDRVH